MENKIVSFFIVAVFIPIIFFSNLTKLFAVQNSFKVYVLVVPSMNLKDVHTARYYYYEKPKSRSISEIQDGLKNKLKAEFNAHEKQDVWEILFCETEKEFEDKANDTSAYLCIKIEMEQYKTELKDSGIDEKEYSEFTANCIIYRRSGASWQKACSRKLFTKSTDPDKSEKFMSSHERMAIELDAMLMNNLIPYQVLGAVSKDLRTKEVRLKAINTSPLTVRKLRWGIPSGKGDIMIMTENSLKPGESAEIALTVRSEESHATIQWRNTYLSDIEFDNSAK